MPRFTHQGHRDHFATLLFFWRSVFIPLIIPQIHGIPLNLWA